MRTETSSVTMAAARLTTTAMVAIAMLLSSCAVKEAPPSGARVQRVVSPLAAVVRLAALLDEREPIAAVRNDTKKQKKKANVLGWRDHLQVSMPDGSVLSCHFRDTPNLQARKTNGAWHYGVTLTMACDNGRSFAPEWIHGGSREIDEARALAGEIADLWNHLAALTPRADIFLSEATKYREAATKPELPESAREFKVRAENAVAEKRLLDAVESFDRALQIAPWWPQGHYNVALVLGELKEYGLATEEMQAYLTLVPDAANARAAQDKIYAWRGKLEGS